VVIHDDGTPNFEAVTVWQSGYFGYAGKQKVEESILDDVQSQAEKFWREAAPSLQPSWQTWYFPRSFEPI
jgi:hypothetical protein